MDELIKHFSLDFLDALINEELLNYPYIVEARRGINSLVYLIKDEETVIGSIAVKPTPSDSRVYRLSYGRGTKNQLIDDTKMSAIQMSLYNRIVGEVYTHIFSEEFLDNNVADQSRLSPAIPSGLIGPALDTAKWIALNMTGETISIDAQEVLKNSDKTAEYVERMVRVERGNAISETAVSKQPENNPQKLTGPQIIAIGKQISDVYKIDELHALARKLSTDYENLRGETRDRKAQELVDYANRRGIVSELLDILREERPRETWSIETGD